MYLADFKHCSTFMKNVLFNKYCTSFYGAQLLPLHDSSMNDIYKAWRVAGRRVWQVPWTTHNHLLPHLVGCMAPELWMARRSINFVVSGLNSKNKTVKYILEMGEQSAYSVFGGNVRTLKYKYDLDVCNVNSCWHAQCDRENNVMLKAEQVKELCKMKENFSGSFLTRDECNVIINFLCTE